YTTVPQKIPDTLCPIRWRAGRRELLYVLSHAAHFIAKQRGLPVQHHYSRGWTPGSTSSSPQIFRSEKAVLGSPWLWRTKSEDYRQHSAQVFAAFGSKVSLKPNPSS